MVDWSSKNPNNTDNILYFIFLDSSTHHHEFLNTLNGNEFQNRTYVISNNINERDLQLQCEKLHFHLISKNLLNEIQIHFT